MLKIGDFSRLARVTVKALRHYDEQGLLRPAHVDRSTGYRWYAAEQLESVGRILLLKDLGFGLPEIRRLLADPAGLDDALDARRLVLIDGIVEDQRRVRRLDSFRRALVESGDAPPVVLRRIDPILALAAREVVTAGSGRITALFETLEREAARARARADDSPFLLFHDAVAREDRLDVEVCIPLRADAPDLPGARIVEGASRAGAVVYRGGYERTPSLFARLAAWVEGEGGAICGPLREVYHRYGADQRGYALPGRVLARESAEFVTELQAPVALEEIA